MHSDCLRTNRIAYAERQEQPSGLQPGDSEPGSHPSVRSFSGGLVCRFGVESALYAGLSPKSPSVTHPEPSPFVNRDAALSPARESRGANAVEIRGDHDRVPKRESTRIRRTLPLALRGVATARCKPTGPRCLDTGLELPEPNRFKPLGESHLPGSVGEDNRPLPADRRRVSRRSFTMR